MSLDLHSKKEKYWYIFWEELLLEKLQQLDFYRNYTLNTNLYIATTSIINGETALKEMLGPGTDAED